MAGAHGSTGRSWIRSARRRAAAGAAGLAVLAGTVAGCVASGDEAAAGGGTQDAGPQNFLLRAEDGALVDVLAEVRRSGGAVQRELAVINGASVTLDPPAARDLATDGRVAALTPDVPVTLAPSPAADKRPDRRGTGGEPEERAGKDRGGAPGTGSDQAYDADADINSLCNIAKLVGVRPLWRQGGTGEGVDVALIDSGVAPVTGLAGPDKIVNGPDLTPESQHPQTRYLDTMGHGTHMAGIIAGRDPGLNPREDAGNCEEFAGMAPDARIVSVKVADAHGATDVSQVIAGIDWVVQHARSNGMNIRVLNLSFGTDAKQSYVLDPLAHAAEQAWRHGIVTVVSAGNSGFADGRLTNPARNPHLLAVGADDTKGTMSTLDDTIPSFSSRGDGTRNPDIVAPGLSVQSLRVPGSFIDHAYGHTGAFAGRFFRGSGTSQAAAVTSGAVAALLSAHPGLSPDEVRLLIAELGLGLVVADKRAQGNGLLQLGVPNLAGTILDLTDPLLGGVTEGLAGVLTGSAARPSAGRGSLDAARGGARPELDGVPLRGEQDIFGRPFDAADHARRAEGRSAWNGGRWNGTDWTGPGWTGGGWGSTEWTGRTWAGRTWAGRTWASGTWNGRTWAGGTWNGRTWAGVEWSGRTWAGTDFAGGDWQ